MIRTIAVEAERGITWIDITGPTPDELAEVGEEHGLHELSLEDALDPAHLPKFERIGDTTFAILRVYAPDRQGIAAQDLTRKIAIFIRGSVVLTVHRLDLPAVARCEQHFEREHQTEPCSPTCLVVSLMHEVLASYDKPLESAEETLESYEAAIFEPGGRAAPALKAIYELKGTVTLIRRLLYLTIGIVQKLGAQQDRADPLYQDLRESAESVHLYADEILDAASNLLNIHLAIASHRTNEVMRILTLFSVFFLPLTFLVGVYGMNFDWMPELRWRWGYPLALGTMVAITIGVFFWFRRKGWLRSPADD